MGKVYSIKEISNLVTPIAKSYGAARVSIFGSYARGDATVNSDIDFLLSEGKIDDYFILSAFSSELQEKFSIPIDVLTIGALSRDFPTKIKEEEIPIYESNGYK
jgi:predicted nucleotidyltransferase